MVFIIGYTYALRSSWPLPKCHSNEIYNKNINSVTEMGGKIIEEYSAGMVFHGW